MKTKAPTERWQKGAHTFGEKESRIESHASRVMRKRLLLLLQLLELVQIEPCNPFFLFPHKNKTSMSRCRYFSSF